MFQKGVSGNPAGKPKGAKSVFTISDLLSAIKIVEVRQKKKFFIHVIERAYAEDKVLIAVMNRILPQPKEESEPSEFSGNPLEFYSVPTNGDGKERFAQFFN